MFKRFVNWVKVVFTKTGYIVSHPQVLWKEYREEVRTRMWARTMTKEAGLE